MHYLSRRKAVEEGATGTAVGPHVFGVHQLAQLHIRQMLSEADGVEGVTGGTKDGTELRGVFSKAF